MANEIQVNCSLSVTVGSLSYRSTPSSFVADLGIVSGPTPGNVIVPTNYVSIPLGGLISLGGLCRLQNLDPVNYVDVGIWDGSSYLPIIELMPGESYIVRLARHLGEDAIGTGSIHPGLLYARANTASVNLLVEAFSK